jgi:hypothetical protein
VAGGALVAKELLFRYMLSVAKRVKSSMLVANAWHARSDAAASPVVGIGIIGKLSATPSSTRSRRSSSASWSPRWVGIRPGRDARPDGPRDGRAGSRRDPSDFGGDAWRDERAVYAGARAWIPADEQRDDIARALTFVVLVLSNLGLIHANRSWRPSALLGNAESNAQFGWVAAGAVVVLGVVLGVPAISRLFSFAAPTPVMLLVALSAASLSMVWFEGVKRAQGRSIRTPT